MSISITDDNKLAIIQDDNAVNGYIEKVTSVNSPLRHKFYDITVKQEKELSVHFRGRKPIDILEKNRPNEPDDIKKYRLEVWENVTESMGGKVISSSAKIFDPKQFKIEFPENPTSSQDGDLGRYMTEDFGIYRSIWIFIQETLLKTNYADPNTVLLTIPSNPEIAMDDDETNDTDFFTPIPILYGAESVVDFVDRQYYTLWEPEMRKQGNKMAPVQGNGWLIIADTERIRKWKLRSGEDPALVFQLPYDFGEPPAFRIGAEVEGKHSPYWYKSFVAPVAPFWNKVVQRISDEDAQIILHLYTESYEFEDECGDCGGTGDKEITTDKGEPRQIQCKTCGGSGRSVNKGPFGNFKVKRDAINPDISPILPPKAYITKDLAPLNTLREVVQDNTLAGYTAINLEVLFKIGENQSGVAKEIDRSGEHAFYQRVANQIFDWVIPNQIKWTAAWMYGALLSDQKITDFLDTVVISKPMQFSTLFGLDHLMNELKTATAANVSSSYLKQIEREIVNTRFANNPMQQKLNLAKINLKPFPNRTVDQLMADQASGSIRKIDFIRNENIDDLVNVAFQRDPSFLDLTFTEQLQVLEELISELFLVPTSQDTIAVEGVTDGEAVPEREDIEAEAKARLKGSVGVVQGILQIQQSVASGITQYDAAVSLLNEIFGFDDETAREILGNQSDIQTALTATNGSTADSA